VTVILSYLIDQRIQARRDGEGLSYLRLHNVWGPHHCSKI